MVHPDEDAISVGRWSGAAVRTGRVFGKLIGWCIAVRVWGLGLGGVFIVQLTTKIACVVVQPNTNGVRWHGNPWPGVVDDRDQVSASLRFASTSETSSSSAQPNPHPNLHPRGAATTKP